jgi:nicotinate-nucleotide pyrophosphorylase (carboxylating)
MSDGSRFSVELNNELILQDVKKALLEDIGEGDLTASLIPSCKQAEARVICRETAVFCGEKWFQTVFNQLSDDIIMQFHVEDGDVLEANQLVCTIKGSARTILTAERTALNFIQTLSGTATRSRQYAQAVKTHCKVLDTRKTIPGLRMAQKYAVACGGCENHRLGLFDAVLIKENHIMAAGSITAAINQSKSTHPNVMIEVEVESMTELQEAIYASPDVIMLDNFSDEQIKQAVEMNQSGYAKLEVSGNVTLARLPALAELGVDYISTGALTKDLQSIDFSMRFR